MRSLASTAFMKALLPSSSAARAARTEGAEALRREGVDDPGGERQLGADDGEVDPTRRREREQPGDVVGRDRAVLAELRRAGVAGRAEELGPAHALRQLPEERMLAPAAADDQDPHAASVTEVALAGQDHRRCRARSAAAITSASRTLPPGWMTARTPAAASTSRPSRNGKNASDAATVSAVESFD